MPNWCNNTVEIQGNEIFTKLLKSLVDDESSIEDFFKHTIQVDNSGDDDWYGSNCRDIGCKWDVQANVSFESDNIIILSFDSAWSPAIAGIQEFASEHKLSLKFDYEESGAQVIGRGSIDKNGYSSDEVWHGNSYLKGQFVINGLEHIYEDMDCYDNLDDFIDIYAKDLSVEDAKLLKKAINDELDVTVIQLLQLDQ